MPNPKQTYRPIPKVVCDWLLRNPSSVIRRTHSLQTGQVFSGASNFCTLHSPAWNTQVWIFGTVSVPDGCRNKQGSEKLVAHHEWAMHMARANWNKQGLSQQMRMIRADLHAKPDAGAGIVKARKVHHDECCSEVKQSHQPLQCTLQAFNLKASWCMRLSEN